ncbi:MAG: hypothetical protein H6838_08175 [Planctomycetes bacterium]|nr:hypothetical protein [Planctomycetota bacterium]
MSSPTYPPPPSRTAKELVMRSLLPIVAVLLLLSTALLGAYGFAVLAFVWWKLQSRIV